jgi:LmeA-like phospholipid-binding
LIYSCVDDLILFDRLFYRKDFINQWRYQMGLGEPNLGEQALSKAAEMGITQQLSDVEEVHVEIHTDPLKLVQGKVDSVSVSGEGMVMKDALRMESIHVDTGAVAINPASAIFGKIELTQAAEAAALVTLTQDDVNQAFCSDYIQRKMQNLTLEHQGQTIAVSIPAAEVEFLEAGKVHLKASVLTSASPEAQVVEAIVVPSIADEGQRIAFNEVSGAFESSDLQLVQTLLQALMHLADLRNFEFSGMTLVLKELQVHPGKLVLKGKTVVSQIPQM